MSNQNNDQGTDDNKRVYTRLPRPYRVQARELAFPIAKDLLIDVDSKDISSGGLCVESESELPVGTRLHINVHIPLLNRFSSKYFRVYENDTDQHFEAIADIAWTKKTGNKYLLGLQFVNADDDTRKAIDKLVADAFREME